MKVTGCKTNGKLMLARHSEYDSNNKLQQQQQQWLSGRGALAH